MGNNFLRFKLLLLSRASATELYTEVSEIFATLEMLPAANLADAFDNGAQIDGSLLAKITADVAEALEKEAQITGESAVDMIAAAVPPEHAEASVGGTLNGYSNITLYDAANAGAKISIEIDTNCLAKLIKKEFKVVIAEDDNVNMDVAANVAESIQIVISKISHAVEAQASCEIGSGIDSEARIAGESEMTSESDVATPIDTEVYGEFACDVESCDVGISSSLLTSSDTENVLNVGYAPTMYGRTRLSDFSSQNLSNLQEESLSELKYKELSI